MSPGSWHLSEYLEVLDRPVSLETWAAEVRQALGRLQLEVLVHGNANEAEAGSVADALFSALEGLGARPLEDSPRRAVTRLDEGSVLVFERDLAAESPAQENSCTQNVYQVGVLGEDCRRDACLSVLCHLASTAAYQRLRTEEQLGYTVQAGAWAEQHVNGFAVLVQGDRLPPCEVDLRIEEWLEGFGRELERMTEEEFANNVRAVVSERSQRHARLAQETAQHWAEIQPRRFRFDRLRRSVEALGALRRADVLELLRGQIAASAPGRRKLSLRLLGASASALRRSEGPLLATLGDIRALHGAAGTFEAPPPAAAATAAA